MVCNCLKRKQFEFISKVWGIVEEIRIRMTNGSHMVYTHTHTPHCLNFVAFKLEGYKGLEISVLC
jgi:hypothetical protein